MDQRSRYDTKGRGGAKWEDIDFLLLQGGGFGGNKYANAFSIRVEIDGLSRMKKCIVKK
jgi:hypothetical protein